MRHVWRILPAVVVMSMGSSLAAFNAVPATKVGQITRALDANALKPDECAALNLTAVVVGDTGSAASELILGTGAVNTLSGGGGDDCLVAGDGNDTLNGGPGIDVCIGGAGADTYDPSCETEVDTVPPCSSPGPLTVIADRDSWVYEATPTTNSGTDAALYVQSFSGGRNVRSLVHFALPAIPSGCAVTGASLRLSSTFAASGRTLQAFRAASAWTELGVTWANQPATTGTAATTTSGTGWRTWTVTSHVVTMYTGANDGFILRDSVESSASQLLQAFASREAGSNKPELVITFG
jgi:Ca2+-binding RTX toxin-like protein